MELATHTILRHQATIPMPMTLMDGTIRHRPMDTHIHRPLAIHPMVILPLPDIPTTLTLPHITLHPIQQAKPPELLRSPGRAGNGPGSRSQSSTSACQRCSQSSSDTRKSKRAADFCSGSWRIVAQRSRHELKKGPRSCSVGTLRDLHCGRAKCEAAGERRLRQLRDPEASGASAHGPGQAFREPGASMAWRTGQEPGV